MEALTPHAERCDRMNNAVVVGLEISGGKGSGSALKAKEIGGESFVEGSEDGAVMFATAVLFASKGTSRFSILHHSPAECFVIHVEFSVHESNRAHLFNVVHTSFLQDGYVRDRLPIRRRETVNGGKGPKESVKGTKGTVRRRDFVVTKGRAGRRRRGALLDPLPTLNMIMPSDGRGNGAQAIDGGRASEGREELDRVSVKAIGWIKRPLENSIGGWAVTEVAQ